MQDHPIRYTPTEVEKRERSGMGFEGKGVLITGATSGIGAQCARAFARENIRVNAVCPGAVDSPMLVQEAEQLGMSADEGRRVWAQDAPNRCLASTDDITNAIVFLASERARHIHGIALPVDGGAIAI